ncbi:hypothetical protein [Staphylococcus phage vB_StaM_PB50]|nr:hypothetical protein [Staphylococcus phage vB_StaM_PB50]
MVSLKEEIQLNKINKIMNINEDAFNFGKNTSLLREIDDEFDSLISKYNFEKSDFDVINKNEYNDIAKRISDIAKKLFNTNMKLKFIEADKRGRDKFRVGSVAHTLIKPEEIRNITDGITKIVIEEKNGIYYSKPREIEVNIELSSLRYFIEKKESGQKEFTTLNGRMYTFLLLHEIGHNLFFPVEINVLSGGKTPTFELKYKDNKPVQFKYTKEIEADTRRNRVLAAPMILAMSTLVMCLTAVFIGASISMGSFMGTGMLLTSASFNRKTTMDYNLSERSANQLPALYGYSVEMVKFYDLVYKAFRMKSEKRPNNLIAKAMRGLLYPMSGFIKSYKDYPTDSIDAVIKTLKFEISNNNNSNEVKKELKKQLDEIQRIIKYSNRLNTKTR